MRDRSAVDVFEFSSDWHTVRNTGNRYTRAGEGFANVMRGGFSLDRWVRRQDYFSHFGLHHVLSEPVKPKVGRTDPIDRRQTSMQDEVLTVVTGRRLNRYHIGWRFNDAKQSGIAFHVAAYAAGLGFRQVSTYATLTNISNRVDDRTGQGPSALAITLQ
tara:strand:- start:1342 stop:1818 length:477 start_codon:yes stop_codon:yes gene_type:complete